MRQTSPHFGARTSNSGPEVTSQQTTYETTTGTPPDPEQEDIVVERALTFDALSFSINIQAWSKSLAAIFQTQGYRILLI